MRTVFRRLASLAYLTQPLALMFVGITLLSLGVAYLVIHAYHTLELPNVFYYLTLQFLPRPLRALLLFLPGLLVLAAGVWRLSGVVVIPLREEPSGNELVVGFRRPKSRPRIAVLSGGAGMLILTRLGEQVERLTCVTPVQDPVEYYYRASGLFHFQNVYYVVPTPTPVEVYADLDNGERSNIKHIDLDPDLAQHHVVEILLAPGSEEGAAIVPAGLEALSSSGAALATAPSTALSLPLTRLARETLQEADAIILGPGSLFESIVPNLLIPELREILQQSSAPKIYICNLMTEPGLTTGFNVADHIRAIKRYGGFTPDYVLVNAQRIDPAIQQIYAAAHQLPVTLEFDEYEETVITVGEHVGQRRVLVEGSMVIESDLASSVVQYSASLKNPGESRAVRVLRHDETKLAAAILELLRSTQ